MDIKKTIDERELEKNLRNKQLQEMDNAVTQLRAHIQQLIKERDFCEGQLSAFKELSKEEK